MQHSPQEIKTKLGEAVDPDGNVLNMAAVIEVIGILERTPLTKEALEQTRIGRTVNLLRKKTENEDIAKRAKKLVKRWQKLVQNHLEAVRNTNSPLNGMHCNSPIVNGIVKDTETINDSSKPKPTDRLTKGVKRKRSTSNTPTPDDTNLGGTSKTVVKENDRLSLESGENTKENDSYISSNKQHVSKRLKSNDDCNDEISGEQIKIVGTNNVENTSDISLVSTVCDDKNTLDHNDVRWEMKDFSQQTEQVDDNDVEKRHNGHNLDNLSLDQEITGVNGHFGEDGKWYDWCQTMSVNEGNLLVLPYVLME